MAANNCEICGKAFSVSVPRTTIEGHTVCKSCKSRIETSGGFEKVKELEEQEKLRKEQEKLEYQRKQEDDRKERIALAEAAAKEAEKYGNEKPVFSLDGSRGKHMDVYTDKCVITTTVTVGSVVSGNATDGEKTIYYIDVIGFQCKASGLTIGYVQLETASGQMNNGNSNFWGENSFVYDPTMTNITEDYMKVVISYIKSRIDIVKQARINQLLVATTSPADEILKYKNLLDIGAITPEEYEAKKKQLLNL